MCGGGGRVKTFLPLNEKKFNVKSKKEKLKEICAACNEPYGKHLKVQEICPDQIIHK